MKSDPGCVTSCFLYDLWVLVLLGFFLLHPNIVSENMLLVEMEKLQGVTNRKNVHLPIGDRPFYFRSINAMLFYRQEVVYS